MDGDGFIRFIELRLAGVQLLLFLLMEALVLMEAFVLMELALVEAPPFATSPPVNNLSKAISTLYPLFRKAADICASVWFMPMDVMYPRSVVSWFRNEEEAATVLLPLDLGVRPMMTLCACEG